MSGWTDDKVAALRKLWADGLSCSQIGARIGMSRNAVIGKVTRLGLGARRGASPADDPRMRRTRPQRAPVRAGQGGPVAGRKSFVADVWAKFGGDGPEPIPKGDDPADFPNLVAFADLKTNSCRWPIGDPKHGRFGFCGEPKVEGLPYCGPHCRRAYQAPASQQRTKRKDAADAVKARRRDREEVH